MCWQDAQRRLMSRGVWTSVLTSNHSHRNKILRDRNKVAHVELLRGLARPVHKTETKYIIGLFILLLISMLLLNISIISILIKVKNCYKICTFKTPASQQLVVTQGCKMISSGKNQTTKKLSQKKAKPKNL